MTDSTAGDLEQFFFYLRTYAKEEHETLTRAIESEKIGELKTSYFLDDLKKWERNFKEIIEAIQE